MAEETHKGGEGSGWLGFLSVEYYQPYFDVTTSDVSNIIQFTNHYWQYYMYQVINNNV